MTEPLGDFLLVRAGGNEFGLLLEHIVEVGDLSEVHPVPTAAPALRGVTRARGRLVPLIHLGALLAGEGCPPESGGTMVLTAFAGRAVALEVEEADVVTREPLLPVPHREAMPWAIAVVRRDERFVPILNLQALAERLTEAVASV